MYFEPSPRSPTVAHSDDSFWHTNPSSGRRDGMFAIVEGDKNIKVGLARLVMALWFMECSYRDIIENLLVVDLIWLGC